MDRDHQEIEKRMKRLGKQKIAQQAERFLKMAEGDYGFGDRFLGIRVPVI